MREKIQQVILDAIEELNEDLNKEALKNPNSKTKLYGATGALDSLNLVNLIVDIEERLSDELGLNVVLADEKAMSQITSPFRNVESLVNYILNVQKNG